MTPSQKIALEISETRSKINSLLELETRSTEQTGELEKLTGRMKELEIEARAAIAAEPDFIETVTEGTPEEREIRQLAEDADLDKIFTAALEHRGTDGREKELQDHFGLSGNQIPLSMLETRDVTPAPADVGTNQNTIIPGVFPSSRASFLNVSMPRVGVGEESYPVLTRNADVHTPAENDPAAETTGAFSAEVLSPSRLQASFFYSREDRARFRGMDSALRQNLSEALADGLDKQVIVGPNGLLTGTNLENHDVSALTTFALYMEQLAYGRVDGIYADGAGAIKSVVGAETYAHAGATYRNDSVDRNVLERLMQVTGGIRVSAHVPVAAGSKKKQNVVIRRGMRRDMVAPVWEGVTIIPDEVTKAANGQIVITAVMLHAVKILRAAGFYKQQVQHIA